MNIICFHNPDEENGFLSKWNMFYINGTIHDVSESSMFS